MTLRISINEEYQNLIPPYTEQDDQILKQSIKERGQLIPITVNSEGIILDGHHRYRACQELGIECIYVIKDFESELVEKLFVIDSNLKRRHLNSFQKAELALKSKPILEEIARMNSGANLKINKNKDNSGRESSTSVKYLAVDRVNQNVGKSIGLSHETVRKVETILHSEDDDLKDRARKGQMTISQAFEKIKRSEKRNALLNELPKISMTEGEEEGIKLLLGDLEEQSKELPESSIDLILTDPPYDKGSVLLYRKLAMLASRVLKEGSVLATYVSNYVLPEIFGQMLVNTGIKYWWTFAVKHRGGHQLIYPRNVFVEWKPLVWFVKGEKPRDGLLVKNVGDLIESQQPDKSLNDWAQSPIEAEFVIENLTVENQTVLDPFMGAGTFGLAALRMKRQFIGIEIDSQRFELAKAAINRNS